MRITLSTVLLLLVTAAPAAAWRFDDDREDRTRIIMEMDQVRRGDYTYRITPDARVIPRCDPAANRLRRRRDPDTLWFPHPCRDGPRGPR